VKKAHTIKGVTFKRVVGPKKEERLEITLDDSEQEKRGGPATTTPVQIARLVLFLCDWMWEKQEEVADQYLGGLN
jgi:hypothetical protein